MRHAGYDDLLDAIEAGEGYCLRCENGHSHLPPRRVCPDCGTQTFEQTPLPDSGSVVVSSKVDVATPAFADDAPYVTAIVAFGDVRINGMLDVDPDREIDPGFVVGLDVARTETDGERVIVFRPR
ncbi:MAG: nucleic acid-binding protein [Natronomonas sp.]